MELKEAVAERFRQLCAERSMTANELAVRSGVTPSTVYSMMDPKRHDISVRTVKKLCDGLELSLGAFFSDPIFDTLEQEIK